MARSKPRLSIPAASDVSFTHVEKLYFPAAKFRKSDLICYYLEIAPVLLPHLRDRPVTLIRFPEGVDGEKFYEKNVPTHAPDWIQTAPVARSDGGFINYLLINDARTLAWCANRGAIELHPFLHRADDLSRPTHIAFDLDPGEGADLLTCIDVGFLVRDVLTGLGLESFPKVSGSKGLQLYVPLNTPVTYESVTPFAKAMADLLHEQHPQLIVTDMLKTLRKNKVLIDWSQNHEKKTTVGAYSVRGKRAEPYVSLPVTWDELQRVRRSGKIAALNFSPAEALQRVAKHGDLFKPVLKLKQKLPASFTAATTKSKSSGTTRARRSPPRALEPYAAKRDFKKTAEPAPTIPPHRAAGSQRFVIQKHAASRLHYDFRLELDDTLKSWAVPKGVSTEPGIKRAAFQTEDHPLDYLNFEGTIPKGEYGGGTVMVWDVGTYEILGGNYAKGDLKLLLSGKKLKGEWHIFRIKSDDEKPVWLIQKSGKAAKAISAVQDDKSVLTGRTMVQIGEARDAVWKSNRTAPEPTPAGEQPAPSSSRKRPASPVPPARGARASSPSRPRRSAPKAKSATRSPTRKSPVSPQFVAPMTAREVAALPEGREWLYEVKLDGFRALGLKHGTKARLLSRNGNELGTKFPAALAALKTVRSESVLLDGEIVALDASGRPSFQMLQQRRVSEGAVVYYAFDLLHADGEDWRPRPLHERKAKLAEILAGSDVRLSEGFAGPPQKLVAEVTRLGLEGIIAKRVNAPYESGERSGAWVKYKLSPEQEFVIGGYKFGNPLESLVVGYFENGKLMCAGKVRQGLNPTNRKELAALLKPIASDVCPFANLPATKRSRWGEGITPEQMKEIQWLMPRRIAQVSFTEWTRGGSLRHATFKGMRTDKKPEEVVREGTGQE